ncbi:MAG: BatA and WFA domain-containing protein [Pirellulales bacterium]|nr:BatA and WFA domain-containing protein [Pirellulales bacterium]
MTLLAPAMLWSLVALVPLAAIYFLKVRPRRRPTTALFLWERIFQEKRSSSLFQRLRDALSLALMLLAAAAVCLALAQPQWNDQRQDLLIVIDNSASMGARGPGGARLEEAKRLAASIIEGLNGSQRAAVAAAAGALAYRSHLTNNPRELLDAVDSIASTPEALDEGALAAIVQAAAQWQDRRRLIFISDGGFDAARLGGGVELFKVGAAAENIGLVAADLAYLPGGENRLGVYFQVASSYAAPRQIDLSLVRLGAGGAEQLMKVIPLSVEPGLNPPETFTVDEAPPGRWLARLEAADALAADDVAYLAARLPTPIRVSVESNDRLFLENSVLAFAGSSSLLSLAGEGGDVTVAKSMSPEAARAVVFHPEGESPWWGELGAEVEVGAVRVLQPDHPALAHADVATIPFVGARQLTPPPGAQVLAASESGLPLVYVARREGRSAVVVNLDPIAADFYFSAWFPVLVHSAVTHLVGRETPLAATYRPGQSAPVLSAEASSASQLALPGGETQEVRGKFFDMPPKTGFYQLSNGSGRWLLGASLVSAQESLLNSDGVNDSRRPISRGRSPVHWLTVLAIVVLAGESILYHRRKAG